MGSSVVPLIGARLRAHRHRRGMSVRGLAREIGVSASLISQIETDKSTPSVSTLYAITTALDISIEQIFADARSTAAVEPPGEGGHDDPGRDGAGASGTGIDGVDQQSSAWPVRNRRIGPVVRRPAREAICLDSGVTWELLGQIPGKHVDFLLITYQPGGSSSGSGLLMRHSGTEYGYVIGGELTLTLGFDRHPLRAGDSVSFDSTTPHRYSNDGDEPAVGVWFVLERAA